MYLSFFIQGGARMAPCSNLWLKGTLLTVGTTGQIFEMV